MIEVETREKNEVNTSPRAGFDHNGKFAAGNKLATNGGRKKAEFSLQTLIDETIPPARWGTILSAMAQSASDGDVHAARLLIEHRWGKPRDVSLESIGAGGGEMAALVALAIQAVADARRVPAIEAPYVDAEVVKQGEGA